MCKKFSSQLILFFIKDELSYDRYHSKSDRIYRVTRGHTDGQAALSNPSDTLRNE